MLSDLNAEITACTRCPRLVAWRELVAIERPRRHAGETYWARPVPSFGDPAARLLIVGLAPAAHGANRTGRMFTGDRSGEWLYRALHRARFANRAESVAADDGLELRGCWITAAAHCAPPDNKPTREELAACRPFLERELELLADLRVVTALGAIAFNAACETLGAGRPRPHFTHGAEVTVGGVTLLGSYHPSQQNTFTGRLTEPMLDAVFARAATLVTRG